MKAPSRVKAPWNKNDISDRSSIRPSIYSVTYVAVRETRDGMRERARGEELACLQSRAGPSGASGDW